MEADTPPPQLPARRENNVAAGPLTAEELEELARTLPPADPPKKARGTHYGTYDDDELMSDSWWGGGGRATRAPARAGGDGSLAQLLGVADRLEISTANTEEQVGEMRSDLSGLQDSVAGLQDGISTAQEDISVLQTQLAGDIEDVQGRLQSLGQEVKQVRKELAEILAHLNGSQIEMLQQTASALERNAEAMRAVSAALARIPQIKESLSTASGFRAPPQLEAWAWGALAGTATMADRADDSRRPLGADPSQKAPPPSDEPPRFP